MWLCRVFRLPSESTLRRSADVLLLRNRIKLTLTVALTLTDRQRGLWVGPFFSVCVSQVQMFVHWVAERLLLDALHR